MQRYESFGDCLKRCLAAEELSASEAARLVGFSSRNSIFRILSGEASTDIKQRFLHMLHDALGEAWPEAHWSDLTRALDVERLGPVRYRENCAFSHLLYEEDTAQNHYTARENLAGEEIPLAQVLREAARYARAEIVITGCCDSGFAQLLADHCGEAGARGTLTVRHYLDTASDTVCENILQVLPLVPRTWYNARLVDEDSCPPEMMALYRLHNLLIQCWDENGSPRWTNCIRYDREHFALQDWHDGLCPAVELLDRWRFHLEPLKPVTAAAEGPEAFVEYTQNYARLEENCTILSVKPDAHFNCIPAHLLEQAVLEGFEQSGIAAGPELVELISALKQVHQARYHNMFHKHRPTHLVYSLTAMERFMQTGVLSDQFFIQRAYKVEERREVVRVLLEALREMPYFNIHFLKPQAPMPRYEITYYEGKGVMLMDAYTGYELNSDHSEALITLPAFMEGFKCFFHEELLPRYVLSRAETIQVLEYLLVMNVQE